jgi:hypothetical protein
MIISEEIIEEQSFIYNDEEYEVREGFEAGITFAEEYLKDLAIEFAEWTNKKDYSFVSDDENFPKNYWENNCSVNLGTTQELFEIFIKEKYE